MNRIDNPMIRAIRADSLVGQGTCSVIDECYSDEEILCALRAARIRSSVKSALAWAHRQHRLYHGYADDIAATAW